MISITEEATIEDDIIALLREEQFWGFIIISLERVSSPTLDSTAAVGINKEGVTLYYNPKTYFEQPQQQRLGDLIHEALHVTNLHFARRDSIIDGTSILSIAAPEVIKTLNSMHKSCLMKLFNYAADMAINGYIEHIAPDSVFPHNFGFPEGLSLEEYFLLLLKNATKTPGTGGEKTNGGQGQGQSEGDTRGSQSSSSNNSDSGHTQAPQPAVPGQGDVCPICGHSHPGDATFRGDHSGWDKSDQNVSENDIKAAEALVTSMIKEGRRRGIIPGIFQPMFDEIIKPRINVRSILKMFVASCKSENTTRTWLKVNRRNPYIVKGKKREDTLTLVVAIDDSGSISDAFLNLFSGFLREFHKEGVRIIVIVCDTDIQDVYEFTGKIMPYRGRGGTSFAPVFNYLQKERISADGIIFLTDGAGDNPPPYRKAKVLWLVTPGGLTPANWGKVVFLPKDVM